MPCYAAGTRIRTPEGDVPIERLAVGGMVLTVSGEARPIQWIGHRLVDCRKHPQPHLVWPVRVQAGAFAPRLPARDLYLSPDHAVFAEDVLIPIKHLQNGGTVKQLEVDTVQYFHIELERHDVVLAENLPAETFLDTGNRANFANGGGVTPIHADFSPLADYNYLMWESFGYAPLVVTGAEIDRVRARLAARRPKRRRANAA